MINKVFVYAFDGMYKIREVRNIREDEATDLVLEAIARDIVENNPAIIQSVVAVKNRAGLLQDFMDAVHGGFEARIEFEDMISREGVCLPA